MSFLSAALRCTALAAAALTAPLLAQTPANPLSVQIALSKPSAMLGEPLWVDFTITNTSGQALAVSWGSSCCGATELTVKVPEAKQGNGEPKNCGSMACDCSSSGPTTLAPGASDSHRYVLSGNFRLTRPGVYTVHISKDFPYAAASGKFDVLLPKDRQTQTASQELTLTLTPEDPAKLLQLEQSLAAEAAKPYQRLAMNITNNGDHDAYMAAVRAWSDADRPASRHFNEERYAIYQGLAAYPAAGMEPIFSDWQTPPHNVGYGISALARLNTPEARAALAHLAEPVPDRLVNGVKQSNSRWNALRALAGTGDRSYLPLVEGYASDEDPQVRRSAIFGMGELGGEDALSLLDKIARQTTSQVERTDAIMTMGRTKSAKAVPLLIALFDVASPGDPTAPTYALSTLTHHAPPNSMPRPTAGQMQADWRAWWALHGATAKIYGEFDCADKFDQ